MPKTKTTKSGFFLAEVVVAFFVVTVGIITVLGLITKSVNESIDSRDQLIAAQLAQEGIELVRNVRDRNVLAGNEVFQFNFPNNNQSNCRIDYNDNSLGDCNNGANQKFLRYINSLYQHGNAEGALTKFQRRIEITYDTGLANNANNAAVVSRVVWKRSNNDFPAACNVKNRCVFVADVLTKQ